MPENSHLLERSFTVRFRCLLDNTSGFLVMQLLQFVSPARWTVHSRFESNILVLTLQRLDIRGHIKVLYGQNPKKSEDPQLALFCLCTPFGPPSLLEIPQQEIMFKSKHKLDFSFMSMNPR